jgi:catechol 2,3-dioxygenase-like lactoylglutathione lyase family enzyme
MAEHIATGAVHHVRLTVTDTNRAREFFIGLLDFSSGG